MLEGFGISEKVWKRIKTVLWIGTVLVVIKLIFVDYTLDEEYQIVMAYRNLKGDHLFCEMWEPHQTSAFMCILFMKLYMLLTGTTTGIILYLRVVTTAIHGLLSYLVYRTFRKNIHEEYAFLLAMLYFNISPKNIHIPEFGNMQLWFLTILILALQWYYEQGGKDRWYMLLLAGIALSGEVLTYPTCVVLYPVLLIYLWTKSANTKWRDCVILTATCGVCALAFLGAVLIYVSPAELLTNVQNLLSFDPTHDVSGMTGVKAKTYIDNVVLWAIWSAVIGVFSYITMQVVAHVSKRANQPLDKKQKYTLFWVISILASLVVQAIYWLFLNGGYEYLQIHFLSVLVAAAALWKLSDEGKKNLLWGIILTLAAYAAVMYISDLSMYYTLPHGALGLVFCMAVIISAVESTLGKMAKKMSLLLLLSMCVACIGARGYTLRGGKADNTIGAVAGVMKHGPAAGIFADYMSAYIYNCNYEDFMLHVESGDKVLIVANMVMAPGTTSYMFRESEISHFSIVDPTTYDEKLLTYWEQYPDKEPNVIVVDCWYGGLMESPDSWIMKYIEEQFDYTTVNDGRYVRFYRK